MTPAHRRARISEAETERRVLDMARQRLAVDGLSVGIDELNFEELIRDADVTRSAVYRIWPNRDEFYRQLMLELAGETSSGVYLLGAGFFANQVRFPDEFARALATEEGRLAAIVDVCRVASRLNFDTMRDAPSTRTHHALAALVTGQHGEFRDAMRAALHQAEQHIVELYCEVLGALIDVLGRRPLPGVTLANIAEMGSSYVEGCILKSRGRDGVLEAVFRADPFGIGREDDWTLVSLGYTALLLSLTMPDPDYVHDPEKVAGSVAAAMRVLGGEHAE